MKKKSFVIYEDWGNYILNLPVEMAGELSKMIMSYAINGELIESSNPAITAMFTLIKEKMDDDYMKYLDRCERNRRNRNGENDDIDDYYDEEEQNMTNGDESSRVVTNGDDSDYDYHNHNHNHNHISSSKKKIEATETDIRILDYFNSKCNTSYRYKNQEILKLIHGRLKDGFSEDDFKRVIDIKYEDWFDNPDMSKYLKPSTLFRPSHFEEYLNQRIRGKPKSRSEMIDEQMKDW